MIFTEWDLEVWMLRCQEKVFHRYTGIPHIVAKKDLLGQCCEQNDFYFPILFKIHLQEIYQINTANWYMY